MNATWWSAWKEENKEKYEFTQDAFTKTYEVKNKETGQLEFIYDYGRYKIFTDSAPSLFVLKDEVSPEEMQKAEDKADEMDMTQKEKEEEVLPVSNSLVLVPSIPLPLPAPSPLSILIPPPFSRAISCSLSRSLFSYTKRPAVGTVKEWDLPPQDPETSE